MSSQNQIKRRKWALPLLLLAMLPGIHGAARATGHEYGSGVLLGRWGGFESGTEIDSVNRSEGQEGKWSKQNNDFSAFGLSTARVRSGSRALVVHSDSYWFDDGVYSPLYSVGAGERMVVQYYRLVTANTGRARNKTGIKMDADVIMSDSHTNPDSTEVWQKVTWYVSTPETTSGDKYVETRHLGRTSMFHSSEPMYIDDLAVYVLRPDEDGVDTTPPNAPTGFHASATNSDSMTITWTAPVGGLDGGAYMLVYGRSDPSTAPNVNGIYTTNNTIGSGTVIYVGGATALNISNLDPATRYYYRLYAFDKAFNYSSAATLNVQTTADGTLAQALDTFYMDWLPINGGAAGEPYYQTVESRDGEDAAQTGSILAGSTGWSGFYTEVEAPGTVYFWWRTSSHASHYLSFFTNYNWSSPMGEISGITDWALTNFLIGGAGTVELDWEYWKNTGDSGGENCGWVDQVFYAEGIGDLNDALDNTDLTFTASGDSIWVYQEQESSDDTAAARSLPIGNSQSVSLDTTLTGPGLLEFQWKVSSEFGYDFLELRDQPAGYASPATVFRMSGERDWTPVVMYITPGEHDMSWRYVKDASISAGYDAGWVDQVKYTRHTLPIIEGFNAASMPDGWTEEPVVMLPDIDFVATSDWPDATPHEGDRFLRVHWGQEGRIRLISPVFSTVSEKEIEVLYTWHQDGLDSFGIDERMLIQWSTDLINWVDVPDSEVERYHPTDHGWFEQHVRLPAEAEGQTTVHVAFLFDQWGGNNMYLDDVVIRADPRIGEAVGNTNLVWEIEKHHWWFEQPTFYYEAPTAARSWPITHSQTSRLWTVVESVDEGALSFHWKPGSESGQDWMRFFINDIWQTGWSGVGDWRMTNYTLASGIHTLEWRFVKNDSINVYPDMALLDNVHWNDDTVPPRVALALHAGPLLQPGDLAIIHMGDNRGAGSPRGFSLLALTDIPAGTEVKITDFGWHQDGRFEDPATNDGTLLWTAPAEGVRAGTILTFDNTDTGTPSVSAGSVVTDGGTLLRHWFGDQLFIYQGDDNDPHFIYGINAHRGDWDPLMTGIMARHSTLPPTLVNGYSAVAIMSNSYARYDASLTSGTRDELLAAISSPDNWQWSAAALDIPEGPFDVTPIFLDAQLSAGLMATGTVWDPSGLYGTNEVGELRPRISLENATRTELLDDTFVMVAPGLTNAGARTPSTAFAAEVALAGSDIHMGEHYTVESWFMEYDGVSPQPGSDTRAFVLQDDDTLPPRLSGFTIGTNHAARAVLQPGDVAIIGFNANANDDFSFVPLVDIAPDVSFSISTITNTTGAIYGTIDYTTPASGLKAGEVVMIDNPRTGTLAIEPAGRGSATRDTPAGTFNLPLSTTASLLIHQDGNNIYCMKQGNLHANGYSGLAGNTVADHRTANPNEDAVYIGPRTGTKEDLLENLADIERNWVYRNTPGITLSPPRYLLDFDVRADTTADTLRFVWIDLADGLPIEGLAFDAESGIQQGAWFAIHDHEGTRILSNRFATAYDAGDAAAAPLPLAGTIALSNFQHSITYTVSVVVADNDLDWPGDSLATTLSFPIERKPGEPPDVELFIDPATLIPPPSAHTNISTGDFHWLEPGDLAVVYMCTTQNVVGGNWGYQMRWTKFSLLALADIPSNTLVYISTSGWTHSNLFQRGGAMGINEGLMSWQAPATGLRAGDVVNIRITDTCHMYTPLSGVSTGEAKWLLEYKGDNINTNFVRHVNNDQLMIYQTRNPLPHEDDVQFIYGVNTHFADWDPWITTHAGYSTLPPELKNGYTALAISNNHRARYNGPLFEGSRDELLAAISAAANWKVELWPTPAAAQFNGPDHWPMDATPFTVIPELYDSQLAAGFNITGTVHAAGSIYGHDADDIQRRPAVALRNLTRDELVQTTAIEAPALTNRAARIPTDFTQHIAFSGAHMPVGERYAIETSFSTYHEDLPPTTNAFEFTLKDDDILAPRYKGFRLNQQANTRPHAGHLAIIGYYIREGPLDDFSFVALSEIAPDVTFSFSSVSNTTGNIHGTIDYTTPAAGLAPGQVVWLTNNAGTIAVAPAGRGSAVTSHGSFNLATDPVNSLLVHQHGANIYCVKRGPLIASAHAGLSVANHTVVEHRIGPDDHAAVYMGPRQGNRTQLLEWIANTNTQWTYRHTDGDFGGYHYQISLPQPRFIEDFAFVRGDDGLGTTLTDAEFRNNPLVITGLVTDAESGMHPDSWLALFDPRTGNAFRSNTVTLANDTPGALVAFNSSLPAIDYADIRLGIHTVRVIVADNDLHRLDDQLESEFLARINIVDDDPVGPRPPANVLIAGEPAILIATGFEDPDGWADHPAGTWTQPTPEGDYTSSGASTAGTNHAHRLSFRCIALHQTGDHLELPPLDNPGALVLWARLGAPGAQALALERNQGASWENLGTATIDSTNYTHHLWDIDLPETGVELRLRLTGSGAQTLYLDELTITRSLPWTNLEDIDIIWDQARDDVGPVHSGINEYRLTAPGAPPPPTKTNEVHHSITTNAFLFPPSHQVTNRFENIPEGIHIAWLAAIDADDDRPDDRAMGQLLPLRTRTDRTPPGEVANAQASNEGVLLSNSQIRVTWNPDGIDGDGNNTPAHERLSPWKTYVIYYQSGEEPTTNSPHVTATDGHAELTMTGTTNFILTNLTFGSTYYVAIAGMDTAGNLGPLVPAPPISLADLVITQGIRHIVNDQVAGIRIDWDGLPDTTYDVLYTDALSYSHVKDDHWQLLHTLQGTTYTDTGDPPHRPNPVDLTHTMRFYRVSAEGRWRKDLHATPVASPNVYGVLNLQLHSGRNWIANPFKPDDPAIHRVLGLHQLPAGQSAYSEEEPPALVSWMPPSHDWSTWALTQEVWLAAGSPPKWLYGSDGGTEGAPANHIIISSGQPLVLEIPTNHPTLPVTLTLVGEVPTNHFQRTLAGRAGGRGQYGYTLVTLSQPATHGPDNMGLLEAGFKPAGTSRIASDQLWKWDAETQTIAHLEEGPIVYRGGHWRFWNGTSVPADYFKPGDALLIRMGMTPSTETITWTNRLQYAPPVRELHFDD